MAHLFIRRSRVRGGELFLPTFAASGDEPGDRAFPPRPIPLEREETLMKTMHMKRALLVVWGVTLAGLGLSVCGSVEALDGGAPEPLGSIEQRACYQSPSVSWASGSPSFSNGVLSVAGTWSSPPGLSGIHLEYRLNGAVFKTEDLGGTRGTFTASPALTCGTQYVFHLWARASDTDPQCVTGWSVLSYSITPSCPPPPPPTCTECDPASSCQVSSSLVSCGTQPSAQAFESCDGWCIARDACGSNFQICPYQ